MDLLTFVRLLALRLTSRMKDDRGATAVEYGIMVALIAAVIIATVTLLGKQLVVIFEKIVEAMKGAVA